MKESVHFVANVRKIEWFHWLTTSFSLLPSFNAPDSFAATVKEHRVQGSSAGDAARNDQVIPQK